MTTTDPNDLKIMRMFLDNAELFSAAECLEDCAPAAEEAGDPFQAEAYRDTAAVMRHIAKVALTGKPAVNSAGVRLPVIWIMIQGTTKP